MRAVTAVLKVIWLYIPLTCSVTIDWMFVPPFVGIENKVILRCDYSVGSDRLLSVKWYCGLDEFYRYTLADKVHIQTSIF